MLLSAPMWLAGCASDPRTETTTRIVEVPVEIYPDLPTELTAPLPLPPALAPDFTVGDLVNMVQSLYDLADQANRDRATLERLTKKAPVPAILKDQ